jgi:hypothetical protein
MRARRGRRVGTPYRAQQAGVWSYCQGQHDRKESYSKHVMLAIHRGKSCARQQKRGSQKMLTFSAVRPRRTEGLRNFAGRCRKVPNADWRISAIARSRFGEGGGCEGSDRRGSFQYTAWIYVAGSVALLLALLIVILHLTGATPSHN